MQAISHAKTAIESLEARVRELETKLAGLNDEIRARMGPESTYRGLLVDRRVCVCARARN